MKTYKTILDSFTSGQGNTTGLTDKLSIKNDVTSDAILISYLNGAYTLKLQDEHHLQAMFLMLLNKELSNKPAESLEAWIKHISSGYWLSLNHKDANAPKAQVSVWQKLSKYHSLFSTLGITGAESNGKGSKMTRLLCTPNNDTVKALIDNGFSNISPIVDGLTIIGLKCELPSDIA